MDKDIKKYKDEQKRLREERKLIKMNWIIKKQQIVDQIKLIPQCKHDNNQFFKLPSYENLYQTLNNYIEELKLFGYELCRLIGHVGGNGPNPVLEFENSISKADKIYITIKMKKTYDYFVDLFLFIDQHKLQYGYMGSNEWKHDQCKWCKIQMVKKLKYLDPPGKYWFCDELRNKYS
jgi:hypothetical protein